ncbi:MAG: hypothetical protein EOP83_09590 [Verrucomicrobiaceae bacterium]|nr:MAG: hypothetical protein EOP83_09590 [Verrucomicrobiaceae bacterium]
MIFDPAKLSQREKLVDYPHVVVLAHAAVTTELANWLHERAANDPPLGWATSIYTPDWSVEHRTCIAIMMDDADLAFEFKMRFA